jgi:hypothetical protein
MKKIMKNSLFRKKNIDRISSPEQLNDRLRVANPGVWLLLAGILLVLAGICVWGIFGRLNTLLPVGAMTNQGKTICYVKEESRNRIALDMEVTSESRTTFVVDISLQPVQVDSEFPEYLCHVGNLSQGEWVYAVTLKEAIGEDGSIFSANIVIESIAPARFVVN